MDLRVGVEISHSLDVHHDQLVARALKREVTEGLTDTKRLKDYHVIISWLAFIKKKGNVAHLRSEADVVVPHKAGVGVVFDVLALDVVLQVEERFTWSVHHLHHTHLHDVHLRTRQR